MPKTIIEDSDYTMEDDVDEKDDVKRKSRNLSEKKRRDQFNLLINELSSMVSVSSRKMDKSTVLKATIAFLKSQKEICVKTSNHEIREDWQPSFLCNEEFTHLMLEALDGFIMAVSCTGRILYVSESITPLMGQLPCHINNAQLFDLMPSEERFEMKQFLSNPILASGSSWPKENTERYSIAINLQRGSSEASAYERIHLTGYFERYKCPEDGAIDVSCSEAEDSLSADGTIKGHPNLISSQQSSPSESTKIVFMAIGRLEHSQFLREIVITNPVKSEFTSRYSLEWKFLFLDHRAPTIIGYLPFEVLGTSGYDYYHVDDLEKVVLCHEVLMKKGKVTSCFYRFLTKGQQWIWLQSQYYITYHQWNSKPEFIVCTNTVLSYKEIRNENEGDNESSSLMANDEALANDSGSVTESCDKDTSYKRSADASSNQYPCNTPTMIYSSTHKQLSSPAKSSSQVKRKFLQQANKSYPDPDSGSTQNSCSNRLAGPTYFTSSGTEATWTRRASGHYSSSSDCSSQDKEIKRPRLQFSHERAHYSKESSRRYSLANIPEDQSASIYEANSLHDSSGDLSQSLYCSHISSTKGPCKEEPTLKLMSPSSDNSSVFSLRSNSTNNSTIPTAFGSRHQHHFQPSQESYHSQSYISDPGISASMQDGSVAFNVMNHNYMGNVSSSQMASNPNQMVQMASVPFTSMIPIQPVVTSQFLQINNSPSTENLRQNLVLTKEQQQLQEQLRRKHAELQQHIIRQQEELRQVNQQLVMAQYGMNLQVCKQGSVFEVQQNHSGAHAPSYQTIGNASDLGINSSGSIDTLSSIGFSTTQASGLIPSNNTIRVQSSQLSVDPNHFVSSPQAIGVQSVTLPYQLPQHQAQMLFAQPTPPRNKE